MYRFVETALFTNEWNNLNNKCYSYVLLWNLMSKHEQPTMVQLSLFAVCLKWVRRVTDELLNQDWNSLNTFKIFLDDEVNYFIPPSVLDFVILSLYFQVS